MAMTSNRRRARVGEVAGGTAAECAAVCCCCPLTVMNVVVLVVYKVPTGLCRKVVNKNKRDKRRLISNRTLKKSLLHDSFNDNIPEIAPIVVENVVLEGDEDDEEVWNQFLGAGFWRSPSQREAS